MVERVVGHYRILEPIGEGGMGRVFKAVDTRLDRVIALKFVNAEHVDGFQTEARAISAVHHPNIATLFDVGEIDGEPYLAMEFVDGERVAGPLPRERVREIAIQVAEALAAAHEAGIVHRDLKPANIMVTRAGTVKVLDFGLARRNRLHSAGDATATATATAFGAIVGTAAYMSPEQAKGLDVDARSDIFSLGAVYMSCLRANARSRPRRQRRCSRR